MVESGKKAVLRIRFLGSPELRLAGKPVHPETDKTLALLAYLAMQPGPHRRARLAGLLWGEKDQRRAARNLRRALWDLRRVLCPEDSDTCPYIIVTRQDLTFNRRSPYWLDVEEFESRRQEAGSKEWADDSCLPLLASCVRLYQGDFLEGLYLRGAPAFERWMLGERARLREEVLQALQELGDLHTERGEYDQAIVTLQRLLARAPWSERGHRRLMLCYALAGRRGGALMQYERCCRALEKELGTEPLPETTALYQRVLNREVEHPTPGPGAQPGGLSLPFTGRGREHAWLLEQWEAARQGEGALTLIEGEAGVGKTRLVEEVLRYTEGRGALVLRGRCHGFGSGAPHHPIAEALRGCLSGGVEAQGSRRAEVRRSGGAGEAPSRSISSATRPLRSLAPVWLSELSRLLPELRQVYPDLPEPVEVSGEAARQRLFEAVARFTLGFAHCSLFIEDLHWADPATVDLLRYLLHRLVDVSVWFVGAYRREEMDRGHPFLLLRRDLGQEGRVALLRLDPLPDETVLKLVSGLAGLSDAQARPLALV